ncbi:hypothetical protein, partial [Pantoea sp. GbtcB22]|uniref:hypothetical protein n=1 Tax=Pantoea sp. GbtcB22 TaxID=2824767 RepID=UPI001C2F64F6
PPPPQVQQVVPAAAQAQQQHHANGPLPPQPGFGAENLFAPSAIKLFGRVFAGLTVNQEALGGSFPLGQRARIPSPT